MSELEACHTTCRKYSRACSSPCAIDFWLPAEQVPRPGDVGLAALGVILRQFVVDDLASGIADQRDNLLGKLHHGDLIGIAQVDGLGEVRAEQPDDSLDQVGYVAEAAGLFAAAVNGDRFALKGLLHEVGQDPAVIEPHSWPIRVENADNPRFHTVVAMVSHGDRFGEPLGFIVAASRADRVDVSPVIFGLRMNFGVAVDLGGAGEQEPGVLGLGQAQGVVGAERAHLERWDRMCQVVDGAGRTGEMEHVVHRSIDLDRLGDIVLDEAERRPLQEGGQVTAAAGQQVVDADDLIAVAQESLAEMRADETRSTGDDRDQG